MDDARTWTQIGDLLDQVEKSGYWQGKTASFSEWLRSFASDLGLGEASLWRYLASSRSYEKLKQTLNQSGLPCPKLDQLPASVSPENIEIFVKLARVAPKDVLREIAVRVVEGSIRRSEMRRTWEAYRPVLGGRTARGTRTDAPLADPSDPEQFLSLVEARIFTALSGSGSSWTELNDPHLYELFHLVSPEFDNDDGEKFEFDAVAVTCKNKGAPTEYHGIRIRGRDPIDETSLSVLERQRSYCHFLWIALDAKSQGIGNNILPQYVGLLALRGRTVIVLRRAQRNRGELAGDLAKALLVRALHR